MPLVLEDGKIVVSISKTQLIAKGTPLNDKLDEFIDKRNSLEVKIEELERKEARMVLDLSLIHSLPEFPPVLSVLTMKQMGISPFGMA